MYKKILIKSNVMMYNRNKITKYKYMIKLFIQNILRTKLIRS